MKKTGLILAMIILCALVLNGDIFSLKGSGKIVKEKRDISQKFDGVKLSNHGDLYIRIGDQVQLTLEGDDNILPHIFTKVSDNTLVIRTKRDLRRGWSSRRGIRYYLTVKAGQMNRVAATSHGSVELPELTGKNVTIRLSSHGDMDIKKVKTDNLNLVLSSHGNVIIDDIQADDLHVRLSSHGKIRIHSGEVGDQDLVLTSHGDYLAEGLKSENCEVSNHSHGTVKVQVSKNLKARLTSHGRLYYKGNPTIEASKNSRKKIRAID